MIVLDASIIIGHLDADDLHHSRATTLLAGTGEHTLAVSALTLAEVLVGPVASGTLDRATAALALLGVATLPVNDSDAAALAGLRVTSGLKLPDCCVLLAAIRQGASLATFDGALTHTARSNGVEVLGV